MGGDRHSRRAAGQLDDVGLAAAGRGCATVELSRGYLVSWDSTSKAPTAVKFDHKGAAVVKFENGAKWYA